MKSGVQSAPTLRAMAWTVVCAILLVLLSLSTASAAETYHVPLKPVIAPFGFGYCGFQETGRTTPFPKEPSVSGKVLRRGTLRLWNSQEQPIGYIWSTEGVLWLDVNGNEDLTDDPAGTYKTVQRRENWGYVHATFTNVFWPGSGDDAAQSRTVDLSLWQSGGRIGANGSKKSYFSGKLELDGKEYHVGVSQLRTNGSAMLLFRPWADRNDKFSVNSERVDTFNTEKTVFVAGRAFDANVSAPSTGAEPVLELTAKSVPLGEVEITGDYVDRVILEAQGIVAVLDGPARKLKAPAGRYRSQRVRLGTGDNLAYRESNGSSSSPFVVSEGKTAKLMVGGPLTNSAVLDKRGPYISLNYRLVGVGKESYVFEDESRSNPPQFAVYEGERKVASGKFEYG